MNELILVKYGEIILKGLNRHIFEDKLVNNIRESIPGKARVYKSLATIYVEPYDDADIDSIAQKITKVFGVVSVSRAGILDRDIEKIGNGAAEYLSETLKKYKTFKVETKRADKKYPIKSPDISASVGSVILSKNPHLAVDVKNPEIIVNIEVREAGAYVYAEKLSGQGGMPTGSSGKAMLLLSGGIDSPVAGYMMAKRGAVLEAVHFFSHPFTGEKAKEKVLSLAKILAGYAGKIKVHIVPFTEQQLSMKSNCPAEHLTLVMRRMMMMISSEIAKKEGALCLVTGESLGQVASQTMEAISVTDDAAALPCFRPLIGMDKEDIVTVARKINSFETSILPYEDCCTIFVPKHPTTKPKLERILASERLIDVEGLVKKAVEETEVVEIRGES
jgi:thiamine biosynthesis protein ThiI